MCVCVRADLSVAKGLVLTQLFDVLPTRVVQLRIQTDVFCINTHTHTKTRTQGKKQICCQGTRMKERCNLCGHH